MLPTVDSVATLRTFASTVGGATTSVELLGYYAPGDGGGGVVRWTNDTTTADNGGTVFVPSPPPPGPIALDAQGNAIPQPSPPRAGCWKREVAHTVSVLAFGAVPNQSSASARAANDSAMARAIHSLQPTLTADDYARGPVIEAPPGTFYFSSTISVDRLCVIAGASGYGVNGATTFEWPAGVTGIDIVWNNPTLTPGVYENGSGSFIRDLIIKGPFQGSPYNPGPAVTYDHGVHMRGTAHLENLRVIGWHGIGVLINGWDSANGGPETAGLPGWTNSFSVKNCVIALNRGDGFKVTGGNANVGHILNLNSQLNYGWQFWDSSGLGNTYITCHANGDLGGGNLSTGDYRDDIGSGGNTWFVFCYDEGLPGAMRSSFSNRTIWWGLHGGATNNGGWAIYSASDIGPMGVKNHTVTGSNAIATYVGREDATRLILGWKSGEDALEFGLRAWPVGQAPTTFANWYSFFYGPTSDYPGVAFAGPAADNAGRSGAVTSGAACFPYEFYVNMTAKKRVSFGTAAPASGTHERGDRVWNLSPSAGGWAGWICTTAGTPGTWKGYGAIEP